MLWGSDWVSEWYFDDYILVIVTMLPNIKLIGVMKILMLMMMNVIGRGQGSQDISDCFKQSSSIVCKTPTYNTQLNNIILFCVTCNLLLSAILWRGMPPVGLSPIPAYVRQTQTTRNEKTVKTLVFEFEL